ncbi:MAG: TetR/AcrR family transcriptional regulator, partial [Cytophagaceae bacterium]
MEKPATPVRNKEKSKQRLLDAVGKLLKSKGYAALKVNDIAATAGLDKKLIYKYFGGT